MIRFVFLFNLLVTMSKQNTIIQLKNYEFCYFNDTNVNLLSRKTLNTPIFEVGVKHSPLPLAS